VTNLLAPCKTTTRLDIKIKRRSRSDIEAGSFSLVSPMNLVRRLYCGGANLAASGKMKIGEQRWLTFATKSFTVDKDSA